MKKQFLFSMALIIGLLLSSQTVKAQDFPDLDKSPLDVAAFPSSPRETNKLIKVIYSRPQLKGRSLSKLAPNGKVWRTGANEAAEIVLYTDMQLGAQTVKAGTYSLFTIPGEEEWTIIINKDINVWGAYSYDKSQDVARTNVSVSSGKNSLEAFAIAFSKTDNGIIMHLGWDTVRVDVPFKK